MGMPAEHADESDAAAPSTSGRVSDDSLAPTMAPSSQTRIQANTPASAAVDEGAIEAWLGKTIDGRYKIVEVLGEGGMGAVFVAENLNLRKQVALKVIRREYAGDPEIAARFTREAMATASLDHPHVASALDFGLLADGSAFLVIQLVRGKPLRALLEATALPWPQACDIAAQIADALAAAHGAGIVHRDLKPDNVLLERRDDGRYHAKVLDFGIARVADEGGAHGASGGVVTRMGVVMGTPGYMSPEQAIGERVDLRTDLYALGVVLWECIAGRPLWVAESLTELVSRQLSEAPPPIITITGQSVPEALDQLIASLLARRPEGRPESAAIVREALRKLAAGGEGSEVSAAPSTGFSFVRRTEVAPPTVMSTLLTTRSPVDLAKGWVRGILDDPTRRMIAIAALAGVFVLSLVAALVGGDDPAPTKGDPPAIVVGNADADADTAADAKSKSRSRSKTDADADAKADDDDPASAAAASTKAVVAGAAAAIQTTAEIQAELDALLTGDSTSARKAAANALKARAAKGDAIPPFARACADLELAKGCSAKRKLIAELETIGDPRALPALERLADTPKQGCGFLKMRDCLECARKPLASALAALRAAP